MMNRINYYNKSGKVIRIILTALVLLFFSAYVNKEIHDSERQVLSDQNSKISSLSLKYDDYSESQWYINNPGYYINYSSYSKRKISSRLGIDMNVTNAWESIKNNGATKREVIVAIIDTGVDYTHPDLSKNIWVNHGEIEGDKIDNDNNGYIDDIYGWDFYNKDASVCHYEYDGKTKTSSSKDNDNHGTHIAGIIAAVADNKIGIAGIASNINIKLMILKINGGNDASGYMSSAIEAVKYATMMGADICNLSWGTSTNSKELYKVMKESDMLFVAAAGNSGVDNDKKPIYPANYKLDNLISVTSIDSEGELSSYSDYGVNSVDIAAPGNDIYSTVVGGDYNSMSGSSMAAPQVTAVAALMYAYNDNIYASNVKNTIIHTLKPIPDLKGMVKHPGIPDAYKAVEAAGDLSQDTDSPKLTLSTIYNKAEMTIPVKVKDLGDSQIRVIKWIYGDKKVEDFKRGTEGTSITDRKVNIANTGVYTFYASDYAGNETVTTYKVIADTVVPNLKASVAVADDDKLHTVTVTASDTQSGLKRIKYMKGIRKAEDFLPAGSGTILKLKNGKSIFNIKKDGSYTVFASDNRGNMVVKVINIKTVKATAITKGMTYTTGKTSSGYKAVLMVTVNSDG